MLVLVKLDFPLYGWNKTFWNHHLWPKLLILGMVIGPFIGNSLLWVCKPLLLLGWNHHYTKDFGETADPPKKKKKLSWKVGHKPIVINGVSSPPHKWPLGNWGYGAPIYKWRYITFQPNLKLVGPHLVWSFSEYDFPWGFSAASRLSLVVVMLQQSKKKCCQWTPSPSQNQRKRPEFEQKKYFSGYLKGVYQHRKKLPDFRYFPLSPRTFPS